MKTVAAVWFDEDDRREIERATRWLGIHPNADLPSGRNLRHRPDETVRQHIGALVHSITESNEPVFFDRLAALEQALDEVYAQAYLESDQSYWIERGNRAHAEVFATSRSEALVDLVAALEVVRAGLPLAQSPRELVQGMYESV